MLKPEKIVRVRIIGLRTMKDSILGALHDTAVMQIEEVAPDIAGMMEVKLKGEPYEKLSNELLRFRGMEAMLPSRKAGKRYFSSAEELMEVASTVRIDSDLKELKSREGEIRAAVRDIEEKLRIASMLEPLSYDLSIYRSDMISSFICSGGKDIDMAALLRSALNGAAVSRLDSGQVLVSITRGREQELARLAAERGFSITAVPEMHGKPAAFRDEAGKRLAELKRELGGVEHDLNNLADRWYATVAQVREQLEIETRKYEISGKLTATEDTFAIEGWVPEARVKRLKNLLEGISSGNVIVSVVKTDRDPPTLLRNPKHIKLFEFFIRFYSLPQEYEIDPTLIFALIFPFFFGLMVGDWGYGLAILLISIFIIHRVDHPVRKSHIPRVLSRFVLMIMGPDALKTLAKALIPSSIVAIVAGLLFNEFFGFSILPFTVFSVEPGLAKLLLLSGYFGLALVTLGLLLGAYNEYTRRHRKGVVAKAGWLLFAWGIALTGLDLIHHLSFNPSVSLSGPEAVSMVVAGAIIIVFAEGSMGAMEIPSIISHILSYTRIVGILLASVILAEVIDIIFLKGVHKSPLFAVVGVIILVIGQLFNLVIAVFEPGIQGARLLYVEFFSKFYRGNGRYFRPFGGRRNYTTPQFSLEGRVRERAGKEYMEVGED